MEAGWLPDVSSLPILAIGGFILGTMLLGLWTGHAVRRRIDKRHDRKARESSESVAQEGFLLGAMSGLLALLLAFSFGMVINRYEERRELVVRHANAIGTAYLRAQFLDEPYRSQLSSLLLAYTANRIALATGTDQKSMYQARNDRYLTEIWATLRSARESAMTHGMTTTLLQTFNDMTDLDAERTISTQLRLPDEILILLVSYMIITAGFAGYQIDGPRGRRAALVLFVLIALTVTFLADINHPMSGASLEPQKPMYLLLQSLRAQPPSAFGPDASQRAAQ